MKRILRIAGCVVALSIAATASGEVIREIESASADAEAALEAARGQMSPEAQASLRRLEKALEDGKRINAQLNGQIEELQAESDKLRDAQTVLKSGLVGALVTAIVAILGALMTTRNSKPERDLKRLAVIEKVRELKAANVKLPPDLARADGG